VHSYTVNIQPWAKGQEPYVLGLVTLAEDESVRLTTNIVGCDPQDVAIDMEVEVVFVPWQELFLPCFRPTRRDDR
jgi:uncharacterized OB-fold protein